MIWIRADANSEIGTGHIMRCLSIAMELQKMGKQVCFVLADASAADLLREHEQQICILQSDYRNMEDEWPKLLSMLQKEAPELILVDSYYVTSGYLKRLREWTKVAYMDDMASFLYPVDMVINYNVYGERSFYKDYEKGKTEFLLGMKYAPLRQEFQGIKYEVRPEVKNVLITTGGSDKFNLAGQILETVLSDQRINDLQYHVVSGRFNLHLPILEELARKYANVHVYNNVTRMSELMEKCDVAVSAAGSTMYELCAVGVPILCLSFVDNQEHMLRSFVEKDIVCYGGNYLIEKERVFWNVAENIAGLRDNLILRQRKKEQENAQTDGYGACRIAMRLCELITEVR